MVDARAVVVTTDIVSEGEAVPNAEITFETPAGEPVDLVTTETPDEPPIDEASSGTSEMPTPDVTPKEVPDAVASGTPPGSEERKAEEEPAGVPAESGTASSAAESASQAPESSGEPKKKAVTAVSTDAEGRANFEIDDRFRGQSLIMVVKKDGRVIERRRVVVDKASLDLSVSVPASAIAKTPASTSQTTAVGQPVHEAESEPVGDAGSISIPSYEVPAAANTGVASPRDAALEAQDVWTGTFFGASFGLGSGTSSSTYDYMRHSQSERQTTSRSTETTTVFDFVLDRFVTKTVTRKDLTVENVDLSQSKTASASGSNFGVLGDIYVGTNVHVTPRILAGVQVEGGVSDISFDSRISREKVRTTQTVKSKTTSSYSDGRMETSSSSSMQSSQYTRRANAASNLDLDWMVSIIGRAGWLATPNTYLYGLAGWTYGRFSADTVAWQVGPRGLDDFGSHGFTVGGGAETKLSPQWSLRAEYRYTQFAEENFFMRSSSASGNTTESLKGAFENDMHAGRVGVTRYFTLGN